MTGIQFEEFMCDELSNDGYWVHRIAPNAKGAQPFDIIALRHDGFIAADCKVCAKKYFPFSRIEENQRSAFETLSAKTSSCKSVGFFAYNDGEVYWLPYWRLVAMERNGNKGVTLTDDFIWKPDQNL